MDDWLNKHPVGDGPQEKTDVMKTNVFIGNQICTTSVFLS